VCSYDVKCAHDVHNMKYICTLSYFAFPLVYLFSNTYQLSIFLVKHQGYSSKCENCRNKQAKRYSGNKTNQAAEVANVADTAATAAALNAIAVPQVPVGAPVLPLPPVVPQEEAGAEPPAPNAQV